ncbi:MAG: hypothetical protein ABIP03_01350 [Aquihabitans sp.]
MTDDRIVRVADHMVDGVQEWDRRTGDDQVRGVSALQRWTDGRWNWQVDVSVAEFLREQPLEGEMRSAVAGAIRSVAGVSEVAEGDRAMWVVSGDPSGEDLVRAVGEAIDRLAPAARAYLDGP